MTAAPSSVIRFDRDGLVPVVVQDSASGDVLMLAFMNDEALQLTRATGEAHYWSRSRQRLWRKGETSGNIQVVQEILINCEQNSLLLLVHQTGAVCHDGYATCYYRRLSSDDALTVVKEQAFDPASVYGSAEQLRISESASLSDCLAELTFLQFGAYAYLRDHDVTIQSATSRRLRASDQAFSQRVSDELRELVGVLSGAHRHTDFPSDVRLEASQVLYWVIVEALRGGATWTEIRPDKALTGGDLHPDLETVARLLHAEVDRWARGNSGSHLAAKANATLAVVALACRVAGLDPIDVVAWDLAELRTRPYLSAYFGREDCVDDRATERARTGSH